MVGMDYREVQGRMRANVVPNEMSSNELYIRACNGVRMMHYTDALEAVWSPSTLLLKHWRSLEPFSSRRVGACKTIQRAWRRARYDPEYAMCKTWCRRRQASLWR